MRIRRESRCWDCREVFSGNLGENGGVAEQERKGGAMERKKPAADPAGRLLAVTCSHLAATACLRAAAAEQCEEAKAAKEGGGGLRDDGHSEK